MLKLWSMVIGVIPLWAVMQYMALSVCSMAVVYALYFMVFTVVVNRAKRNRKM